MFLEKKSILGTIVLKKSRLPRSCKLVVLGCVCAMSSYYGAGAVPPVAPESVAANFSANDLGWAGWGGQWHCVNPHDTECEEAMEYINQSTSVRKSVKSGPSVCN